jgi:pyridoxine kinase
VPTILSIQSEVVGARVGNSVAAFAMERLGVRVLALPTVLLGRRPDHGPPGGGPIPAKRFATLLQALADEGLFVEIDAVLTGYIGEPEQAPLILDAVARIKSENPKALFICDPVLGDDGKLYVAQPIADAVIGALAPAADWLAPNAFELGVISGLPTSDLTQARDAAKRLEKPVLCSSIRTALGIGNLLAAPTGDWFCETPRLPRAQKGAGDLLTALFVARRVRGDAPVIALEGATGAVYDIIVRSLAGESEHLLLPQAQELLDEPVTWPQAQPLERADD